MDSIDLKVLKALFAWRSQGLGARLVTVSRTWGSAPRPAGSMMALCEDGSIVGSVSGGCVESDLLDWAQAADGADSLWRTRHGAQQRSYGVSADEAHRWGLPCGGTLELLIEQNPDAALLGELLDALKSGQLVARRVCLASGAVQLQPATHHSPLALDARQLVLVLGPAWRMLLIGAGQLAEYLATMALFNGFAVTVCDPREEYMRLWSVAAVELSRAMPDDAVLALRADQRSAIVALSHDPKLDDLALLEALNSPAFYVGAIGSKRNQAARRARMIEYLDQTEASMDRLHGPAGLYIGSKTPAEIAVSIMAEIIAVKNGLA